MKITTIFWLAALIACLPTCKKNIPPIDIPIDPIDTIVPPPIDSHIIELGKVSVLKNGIIWDAPFNAWFSHLDNSFLIEGIRMNYLNGVEESFTIDDIPCTPGKYQFEFWPSPAALYPNKIPNGVYIMVYDGDQPVGHFHLDTLRNDHFVEVLNYDTLTNIIEGQFQMFIKKEPSSGWQPSGIIIPDSVAMTEGKFRLQVKHF